MSVTEGVPQQSKDYYLKYTEWKSWHAFRCEQVLDRSSANPFVEFTMQIKSLESNRCQKADVFEFWFDNVYNPLEYGFTGS